MDAVLFASAMLIFLLLATDRRDRRRRRTERRARRRARKAARARAAAVVLAVAAPSAIAHAQVWKLPGYYPPPWADADLAPNACLALHNDTSVLPDGFEWEALLRDLGAEIDPYAPNGVPVDAVVCASGTDLRGPVIQPDCMADCQEATGNPEDPPCTADCWETRCEIRFAQAGDLGPFLKRLSDDESVCPIGLQPEVAVDGCWATWTWLDGLLRRSRYVRVCETRPRLIEIPEPETECFVFGLGAGNGAPAFQFNLCPTELREAIECLRARKETP